MMILKDGRRMTLIISRPSKVGGWKDKHGESLATLTIPFAGSHKQAEEEIRKLERLASEARVISGMGNNINTNPPKSVAGKRLKYTWRFFGVRSHMAEFVKNILCQ